MLHGTLLLSYIGEIHYAFELWNKLQTFDLESLFLNLVIHIKWCTFFLSDWLSIDDNWNEKKIESWKIYKWHINRWSYRRFWGWICLFEGGGQYCCISTYLLIHWSKDWMKLIFKSIFFNQSMVNVSWGVMV